MGVVGPKVCVGPTIALVARDEADLMSIVVSLAVAHNHNLANWVDEHVVHNVCRCVGRTVGHDTSLS